VFGLFHPQASSHKHRCVCRFVSRSSGTPKKLERRFLIRLCRPINCV